MDIERMGIESIDSFDAKSYKCRIEFLGIRFDVESAARPFDSHRIECDMSCSMFECIDSNVGHPIRHSNRTGHHMIRHRIDRPHPFDRKSIDSVEQRDAMCES
jgi:hypothetical protein